MSDRTVLSPSISALGGAARRLSSLLVSTETYIQISAGGRILSCVKGRLWPSAFRWIEATFNSSKKVAQNLLSFIKL